MSDLEIPIRKWLSEVLEVDASHFTLCRTTAGKHNHSWFVQLPEQSYVLRVAPPDDPALYLFYEYRMMRREPELHAILRRQTTVPVPKVIAHCRLHPEMGPDAILLEQLPGKPLSAAPNLAAGQLDRVLFDVGNAMRQVHAIRKEDEFGYPAPPEEPGPLKPQTNWHAAFGAMWEALIQDVERCGGYTDGEGNRLRRLWLTHHTVFKRNIPASLLHMDVWAENILVDAKGRLTGLLDWDRAVWGDPEIEFAVLDYCGISQPAFWEGYGQADPRKDPDSQTRRLFYLLYEMQKYIFISLARRGDQVSAEAHKQQCFELALKLA
jgi:aminoglycoside phosphotransferase (APT) family kinase protein